MSFVVAALDFKLTLLARYHEARYPSSRTSWWCKAYLWSHLRRDPWCSQALPRGCKHHSYYLLSAFAHSSFSRSFATRSPTLNTPRGRLSLLSTLSTLSSAQAGPFTVSVLKVLPPSCCSSILLPLCASFLVYYSVYRLFLLPYFKRL